jgi:hypothetical protein
MWSILGPLLGIGSGIGIYELFFKKEPLSEVVQFTQKEAMIQRNSNDLTGAGIPHDINTDGVNSWIMVTASNRTKAVQVVRQAIQA